MADLAPIESTMNILLTDDALYHLFSMDRISRENIEEE